MEPSTTDQSLPACFSRYECHPFKSFPSNNNCHPSCFSCCVSAFGSCAHAMPVNKTQTVAAVDNLILFIITPYKEVRLRVADVRRWEVLRDSPRVVARNPVEEQSHEATFIGFKTDLSVRRAFH